MFEWVSKTRDDQDTDDHRIDDKRGDCIWIHKSSNTIVMNLVIFVTSDEM
jgi:hypothetical protein